MGNATITAKTASGLSKSASVTVVGLIDKWTIDGKDSVLKFYNTHPVFSDDKTHAYIVSTTGQVVSIDLENGTQDWVFSPASTGYGTICVNPVSGAVYTTNKNNCIYAINNTTGEELWKYSFKAWGTSFAISKDGSVVFAMGGDNRQIAVLDAQTGELKQDYNAAAAGGSGNIYTGAASGSGPQLVIFGEDEDYEYLAVQANEVISVHKFSKTEKKLNFVWTQKAKPNNANNNPNNLTGAVVSPDKNYVYFLGTKIINVLNVSDLTNITLSYATVGTGTVSGLVLDENEAMYFTSNNQTLKYDRQSVIGSLASPTPGAPSPLFDSKVSLNVNYLCPAVTSAGNFYYSVSNSASLFMIPSGTEGNEVSATTVCQPPVKVTGYQSVFAMTDGYAVIGVNNPGYVYIVKVDETIAPKTWGYFGGDCCATMNANLVY